MSAIASLLRRAFSGWGAGKEARVLFLGLDASGRTTALYLMKLGELVQTIPTIGFNVETIECAGMQITAWDVGGCDKIRPLWRHYFQNTTALVFFVDSNDRERLDSLRDEVLSFLNEPELRGLPALFFANKQDLPNALTPAEITVRLNLETLLAGRAWRMFGSTCKDVGTFGDGFQWLVHVLKQPKADGPAPLATAGTGGDGSAGASNVPVAQETAKPSGTQPNSNGNPTQSVDAILERWLSVEDESDDEFLAKFAAYTLDSWDHRTHLRIAWLFLQRHGRREGMRRTFDGIKAFIENSDRARKTTFHESLTYFWVHMVHYALVATPNPLGDFKGFLLMNPRLCNGGLFLENYTKDRLMKDPEARKKVILPDIKPLPSMVGGTAAPRGVSHVPAHMQPRASDSDDAFLRSFEANTLPSWGHVPMLRVCYVYLRGNPRRVALELIFSQMERRMRDAHHVTMTYFWLQMVAFAIASHPACDSFASLLEAVPSLTNAQSYREYYSDDIIFAGTAATQMVLPDKKQLPNVVG
eukprot:Opistho-2@89169